MISALWSAPDFAPFPSYLPPVYHSKVCAGFPTLIDETSSDPLDLNTYLVTNTASTFFVKVSGHSMDGANIHHGDLLIVDRSRCAKNKDIVVAALNGELVVKRLKKSKTDLWLCSENPLFPPVLVSQDESLMIWGVVTGSIHKFE